METIRSYVCSEEYTPLAQILVSLATGLAFAPLSGGFFWTIVFIIIYELILIFFTRFDNNLWQTETRAGVIFAALAGWLIGRELANINVMECGNVPFCKIPKTK